MQGGLVDEVGVLVVHHHVRVIRRTGRHDVGFVRSSRHGVERLQKRGGVRVGFRRAWLHGDDRVAVRRRVRVLKHELRQRGFGGGIRVVRDRTGEGDGVQVRARRGVVC